MKDKKIKKKKDTIRIFGITMPSDNFFALILCTIIGIFMTYRTIYYNKLISRNTEVFTAEVIDVYVKYCGSGNWGYEMRYRYYDRGKEKTNDTYLWDDEKPYVHVGDCIEIIVSREDNKIQEWNRSKGTFRCPSEGIQRSSDEEKSTSGAKDNKGN